MKEIFLTPGNQQFFEKLFQAIDTTSFLSKVYKYTFPILVPPVAALINLLLLFGLFFLCHYINIFSVG
jgi:hypothetical protein